MKKSRYTIEFESLERSMTSEIELSKTQFMHELNELTKKAQDDSYFLDANYIEQNETQQFENEKIVTKWHTFRCGTAFVILTETHTKEGYTFLTKSELKLRKIHEKEKTQ